jgi:DNA-binding XRE family transcriptional regulator
MTFAEKMQAVRKQLFLSQEAMAKELGVSFATVNRCEKGKCEPSYKAQKAFNGLCEKHNIDVASLADN